MAKSRGRAVSLSLDWDSMVKEGSDVDKEKAHLAGSVAFDKETVDFCTGSMYTGKWNSLGMAVYGNYIYPHGCEYEGGFEDGMFHGEGTLMYPMGQRLEGIWQKGKMISYKFSHVDGLEFEPAWRYCVMPDRRFNVSLREGLQPAGREFMTNQQPERPIEPGSYDTADGYYNPIKRCIVAVRDPQDYEHLNDLEESRSSSLIEGVRKSFSTDDFWVNAITMVSERRHQWIIKHCRKSWDEPAGYRPDLYEDWISGRKTELEQLDAKYANLNANATEDSMNMDELRSLEPVTSDTAEIQMQMPTHRSSVGRKINPADASF